VIFTFITRIPKRTTSRQPARKYEVDGIVVEVIQFGDTWGVESSELRSVPDDAEFRVLPLEREYGGPGEGQLRTRGRAFLESMGKQ